MSKPGKLIFHLEIKIKSMLRLKHLIYMVLKTSHKLHRFLGHVPEQRSNNFSLLSSGAK